LIMAGFIFYAGPSVLDGAPIVAVALLSDKNRKTGVMVQTYILRADLDPIAAAALGLDASICGDCKHRPSEGGACYVNLGHGPLAVFTGLLRGIYPDDPDAAAELCADEMVRMGTYGDPMAVPVRYWRALLKRARGHTGYSHAWLRPGLSDAQRHGIMELCMASADTETEGEMAQSVGWRTFRVRAPGAPMMPGEFICPASAEGGKRKQCADCGACDGVRNRAASPVIIVHGSKASRFAGAA
jgi:hypothetical protein